MVHNLYTFYDAWNIYYIIKHLKTRVHHFAVSQIHVNVADACHIISINQTVLVTITVGKEYGHVHKHRESSGSEQMLDLSNCIRQTRS